MSALPPKADIAEHRRDVRFVPIADSYGAANRSLFDNLVGGREQRRRHGKAEHPGGLMIDDQLELARLYDRQIGRLHALEDAAGIDPELAKRIRNVGSVAHQTTDFGIVS
jgi:hypothetical protein